MLDKDRGLGGRERESGPPLALMKRASRLRLDIILYLLYIKNDFK